MFIILENNNIFKVVEVMNNMMDEISIGEQMAQIPLGCFVRDLEQAYLRRRDGESLSGEQLKALEQFDEDLMMLQRGMRESRTALVFVSPIGRNSDPAYPNIMPYDISYILHQAFVKKHPELAHTPKTELEKEEWGKEKYVSKRRSELRAAREVVREIRRETRRVPFTRRVSHVRENAYWSLIECLYPLD